MLALPTSDAAYLAAKYRDHERDALRLMAAFGFAALPLWLWDRVIDPAGARSTWPWHLLILAIGLAPLGLRRLLGTRRNLSLVLFAALVATALAFCGILVRLGSGLNYGPAGFVWFQLMGLLVLQACSFPLSLVYHCTAALLPNLLGLLLPAAGVDQLWYAGLVWPAAGLAVLVRYVMERQNARGYALLRQIEDTALADPLTGAYSRRYFSEVVVIEMARVERDLSRLSMLLVEIDDFAAFARAGPAGGEQALRAIAALLKNRLRPSDRLFRWDGQQFLVLAPSAALSDATALAERLRRACQAEEIAGGRAGLSIGIAEFAGEALQDWIRRAGDALVAAQQGGGNRVEAAQKRR